MKIKILTAIITMLLLFSGVVAYAQVKTDTINKQKINYGFGSKNYPGVEPGEVFFCYISETYAYDSETDPILPEYQTALDKHYSLKKNFDKIVWKTKRLCPTCPAYDLKGRIFPGYRPVFVQEWELKKAGSLK
jgi:hypothetical protein